MDVCKVKGCVVSTNKCDKLTGMKLMVVSKLELGSGAEQGCPFVSIDTVGAGVGEIVLVVNGSSARQTAVTESKPVDSCIVAIVDSVEVEGTIAIRK